LSEDEEVFTCALPLEQQTDAVIYEWNSLFCCSTGGAATLKEIRLDTPSTERP